jgi:hypothetical protein
MSSITFETIDSEAATTSEPPPDVLVSTVPSSGTRPVHGSRDAGDLL